MCFNSHWHFQLTSLLISSAYLDDVRDRGFLDDGDRVLHKLIKYESKMVGFVDFFCIKDVRIFSAIRQNIQALAFELRQKSIKSYASFLFYIFYGKIHVCDWMKILIRLLINAQTLYSKK
ncbi:hypothetical protein PHYBLDRAFT_67258 [Phycomyces blakesleeanus NRRL 1555(-)]|uniref:Uncharacterized protein n=1 Tax=Phycomyces blakesleeanus (strain ATCC 8743b / DSM 1359 / FGSC 10004 / NBRC 33097 / NRRL 1555) TaxID=763407 RepID=A0A162N9L0_PHYB8|nr:hypothetical protein PHYBLDRAFT_67258 [Phycomyces blakesleeanus NRRL 1555(-)]OAD67124.1 hypothetical protein PHYBLDRAFT_67258 [Phycomyces blakesleeanus NRRL 1555(-)]|eukprot:XP_018285164.1 hypothetical protein PHYBLDRAFT_67258 [Phycomyces blakesleeanus NRRL 1555(-)]